jgi:hypothetical protein
MAFKKHFSCQKSRQSDKQTPDATCKTKVPEAQLTRISLSISANYGIAEFASSRSQTAPLRLVDTAPLRVVPKVCDFEQTEIINEQNAHSRILAKGLFIKEIWWDCIGHVGTKRALLTILMPSRRSA